MTGFKLLRIWPARWHSARVLPNGRQRSLLISEAGACRTKVHGAGGAEYKNIIASYNREKQRRIIVGAHYDVRRNQPGADDNASAIAGLIETSRLVAEAQPDFGYRMCQTPRWQRDIAMQNDEKHTIGQIRLERRRRCRPSYMLRMNRLRTSPSDVHEPTWSAGNRSGACKHRIFPVLYENPGVPL